MPDMQAYVNEFIIKLKKRKIEGSQATARQAAELLRSVISQQRLPYTNQAGALIDAIKDVGEKLIAANPGLKVLDSSVENLASGAWQALGTAWKGGSNLVHKLEQNLTESIQHGNLPVVAGSVAPSLIETGKAFTAKGMHVLELVGKETIDLLIAETGLQLDNENSKKELAVGNIVRRVLHIIREEDLSLATAGIAGLNVSPASDDDEDDIDREDRPALAAAAVAAAARSTLRPPSLQTLLEDIPDLAAAPPTSSSGGDSEGKSKSADKSLRSRRLKHDVIEAVNELIQDIATCHEQIAEQAVEHIHQNEVILTLGSSKTVIEFLCAAKEKKRSFRVFVAEGAPRYQGHLLAKELVERGLQTTMITDSAVVAMISRVNMVIVGAHAVMANGGVIAPVGLNMVALAAQRHAVPFVVLAGSHKLCPLYPHNPEVLLNELRSPSELLDFGDFSDCMDFGSGTGSPLLHVVNPAFDYVPPKLVSLFITDTGGHNPSYMYRLIADYYSADDFEVISESAAGKVVMGRKD